MQLRHVLPAGVSVLTHRQLIEQLWDLHGTGTAIVTPLERKVLLRPLVQQVALLDSNPSPGLVNQLGDFVQEALGRGASQLDDAALTESDLRVKELVSLYERELERAGLVEMVQAERALVQGGACAGMSIVFEAPDLHSAHVRSFVMELEAQADVTAIEQELVLADDWATPSGELASLRQRLFTGKGGTAATGCVRVGVSHGAHAAQDVTVGLVRLIHDQDGVAYEDMVICPGSAAQAYPRLHEALARAGIPFVAQFSLPCMRTGLGAAFRAAERALCGSDDDASFDALVDLASSPYAGIANEDARALQMRWRERAHSTADERLRDIRLGFAQGNATQAMMQERLQPLCALLDASHGERVKLLFEHARAAHADADVLEDDRIAAEALLDYLEACERLSCEPSISELEALPVNLARSFGDASHAVRIIESSQLGLARAGAILLCDLDAQHYPMALQAAPFDALMSKLGIKRIDTFAHDQRLMLLNVIESCDTSFAFTRSTHDAAGDQSCQSALYEELLSAYRTSEDDAAELLVQGIPAALRPWSLSMSEADAFLGDLPNCVEIEVNRGSLENPALRQDLVEDVKGKPLPFSPTALEDYYRCPYRWFACRRVGYNGMDVSFDAASQGNLVHAVMERFYANLSQMGHARVTPDNLEQALELASVSFDQQVELECARERRGLYLRTRYDECACEELRSQVLALVERDAEFLPDFAPTYFELSLGSKVSLEYAGVPVRGKVDRIDVDAHGNAIVIDYKLSSLSAGYGFTQGQDMPQRIQTDIYATLVERHFASLGVPISVVGSVYRSYSKNNLRGVYSAGIDWGPIESVHAGNDALPNGGNPQDYRQYLAHVEQEVSACVDRLRSGFIEPDPLASDVCEYCKARAFCPKGGA